MLALWLESLLLLLQSAVSYCHSQCDWLLQGSVFSALLTDMMEAVRWPAASSGGTDMF